MHDDESPYIDRRENESKTLINPDFSSSIGLFQMCVYSDTQREI